MRAFVAVFPPPDVRLKALAAVQRPDGPPNGRVRWTRPENVHLTLKFLGDVREEALGDLRDALRGACRRHAPFDVGIAEFGAFPSARRARILWAGVGAGAERLRSLAADIEASLVPLWFEREDRAYVPHLTLGRVRGRPASFDPPPLAPDLGFRVGSADLVESTLSTGGPVYEVIDTFVLGVD